jgi:hypothetical protein
MNGPGPIKQAISNVKARKEEKKRATEQGYKYNRNIIHDVGENKSRNIKGSVGAAAQSKVDQAKKDVKKVSSSVKKAVESKVDKMQESSQARKAMKAADERSKNNRIEGKTKKTNLYLASVNEKGKIEQADRNFYNSNKKQSSNKGKIAGKNVIQKMKNSSKLKQAHKRSRNSGVK